jgi:L-lactate dehydrogenase complex protein LldG
MSGSAKILSAIAANKPALVNLPEIRLEEVTEYKNVVEQFTATLEGIGGKVREVTGLGWLVAEINKEREEGKLVLDAVQAPETIDKNKTAAELEQVHIAYLSGSIGVAENGALWVKETQMVNRLLPFICQHLVILLEKDKIVSTMHHAYRQINSFEEGFGVFIAGPSKTADIEQSLVIGAHGARSLTVYLIS